MVHAASLLCLGVASVLTTLVALSTIIGSPGATTAATTGACRRPGRYALPAAVLLALVWSWLVPGPALAHQLGYEADTDHDGYIEVYRSSNFYGDWKSYQRKANGQLKRHTDEPLLRMVDSKDRAELWVHKDPSKSGCFGAAYSYLGTVVDEVRVSPRCSKGFKMRTLLSHEVGHIYGLPAGVVGDGSPDNNHHHCTSFWQKLSVNVGETPGDGRQGCSVQMVGFGSHDLRTLAQHE